jgi:hypothetical protein
MRTELALTPTHKIKKVDLKKEGFDPDAAGDEIYVLLPGASAYEPLTKDIYTEIQDGKYKF